MAKSTLEELSDKIWATKQARFCAHRRMKRCRVSSTMATTLLSVDVVAINLIAFLPSQQCPKIQANITVFTIVLSVFILAMSLLVYLLDYSSRENNYHNCGVELTNLNDRLSFFIKSMTPEEISQQGQEMTEKYLRDYQTIISKYNLNHSEFDYVYTSLQNKGADSKPNRLTKLWYESRWYIFDVNTIYLLLSILPIICICRYLFYAMYV